MRYVLPAVLLALTLAACGPGDSGKGDQPKLPAAQNARDLPTGPVLSSVGVVISVDGPHIVLDHEAAPGGLAAGRTTFTVDAAVLAEAPLDPGSRVAFSYQDWTPEPLLVELKAR